MTSHKIATLQSGSGQIRGCPSMLHALSTRPNSGPVGTQWKISHSFKKPGKLCCSPCRSFMIYRVSYFQILAARCVGPDMCILGGGFDGLVAQRLLDERNRRAILKRVGSVRMAHPVR